MLEKKNSKQLFFFFLAKNINFQTKAFAPNQSWVFSDLFHARIKLAPLLFSRVFSILVPMLWGQCFQPCHPLPNAPLDTLPIHFFFFQEQIRGDLEKLKKRREEILGMKRSGERRCQDCLVSSCCHRPEKK